MDFAESLRTVSNSFSGGFDKLDTVLYLREIPQAYDTDIHLSFGMIHINSKESVSQISFNGSDVTDMDAFIVKQAFRIEDDNY